MRKTREHSIFISYRKVDGTNLALWVDNFLNGKSFNITQGSKKEPILVSSSMDLIIPPTSNWKKFIADRLSLCNTLVIICSPSGLRKRENQKDYYYEEIEWWIRHKPNNPPLIITDTRFGFKSIPDIIKTTWPEIQICELDLQNIHRLDETIYNHWLNSIKESIIHSISLTLSNINGNVNLLGTNLSIYTWEKDRYGKYTHVNENYCAAAGYDAPISMYGKTDYDMPWFELADLFRLEDRKLIHGSVALRDCSIETEIMVDRTAIILVTESRLSSQSGRAIGVQGMFTDISNFDLKEFTNRRFIGKEAFSLGPAYDNIFLTRKESIVLNQMIKMVNKKEIRRRFEMSIMEMDYIIKCLMKKLQCFKEKDIITAAIRSGLAQQLLS